MWHYSLIDHINVISFFIFCLRCLYALYQECENKRNRRDVSTEVVNNVIVTSKPMNNFRLMLEDIFGEEAM